MTFSIDYNGNKGFRLLNIYERLNKGEFVDKSSLAESFGVTQKTIQRDLDDLRAYLAETHFAEIEMSIKYDKARNGYYLVRFEREWLTNEEVLVLCKILLESRAFEKSELKGLIKKLTDQVVPNDRRLVEAIIQSEYYNYVPLRHGKKLLSLIWALSEYIYANEIITFKYQDLENQKRVKPVSIIFSGFYFYLIAFLADDSKSYPAVFRIDRIDQLRGTKQKFVTPYKDRFNAAEFRNRVQFMYGGELKKIVFEYTGSDLDTVLDRLPAAKILSQKDAVYTIETETYGEGVLIWLHSLGEVVKILA